MQTLSSKPPNECRLVNAHKVRKLERMQLARKPSKHLAPNNAAECIGT